MKLREIRQYIKKRWLTLGLTILAIILFVSYLVRNLDRYQSLFQVSVLIMIEFIILIILSMIANGVGNYYLYQGIGLSISLIHSVGLAAVNTLANQLPFSGGLIAKGVYLKKRYDLAYTEYLSATGALYVCFLATNGLIGVVGLVFQKAYLGMQPPWIFWVGFGFMVSSLSLLWLPINLSWLPDKFGKHLENIEEGWHILRKKPSLLFKLVGIQVTAILIMAARYWLAFEVFSQSVSLLECLLFSSATILTRLISIAPGGLGVREGIVAGMSSMLGFDPAVSAVAVGFDRLIATTLILILGTYFTYVLGLDALENEPGTQVEEN